jgi:crossover junction endodeoxyribonuclease RuvC
MRVMGIDLSTSAGVAVVDHAGKVLHAGVVTYPKLKGKPRIHAIVGDILHLRETLQPDHIFIEDYALGLNMGAVIVQVELASVLQFILWQDGIPFELVSPGTLKKFVTGSGGAKKELMMLHVFKRWGHESKGNDECDAVALAHFGLAAHGNAIKCTSAMLDVVEEWHTPTQPVKKPKRAKGSGKNLLASA